MLIRNSKLSQQFKDNYEIFYAYSRFSVAIQKGEIDSAYYFSDLHQNLASKTDNEFYSTRNNIIKGMIALFQKDYNNALLYFEKSNQQNPYNIYRTAISYEGLGKIEKAKTLYDKAAHFNTLNDFSFFLIRQKALKKSLEL